MNAEQKEKRPVGRPPLKTIEERGYVNELTHLARLRSTCLSDRRLSLHKYTRIAKAISVVENELKPFAKSKKVGVP